MTNNEIYVDFNKIKRAGGQSSAEQIRLDMIRRLFSDDPYSIRTVKCLSLEKKEFNDGRCKGLDFETFETCYYKTFFLIIVVIIIVVPIHPNARCFGVWPVVVRRRKINIPGECTFSMMAFAVLVVT